MGRSLGEVGFAGFLRSAGWFSSGLGSVAQVNGDVGLFVVLLWRVHLRQCSQGEALCACTSDFFSLARFFGCTTVPYLTDILCVPLSSLILGFGIRREESLHTDFCPLQPLSVFEDCASKLCSSLAPAQRIETVASTHSSRMWLVVRRENISKTFGWWCTVNCFFLSNKFRPLKM